MALLEDGKLISKKEFRLFLVREFFPKINFVESERKRTFQYYVIGMTCITFLLFLILDLHSKLSEIIILLPAVVGLLCVRSFIDEQKMRYMPVLFENLGDMQYHQTVINQSLIKRSLLQNNFVAAVEDAAFSGTYGKTTFSVSEMKLERVIRPFLNMRNIGFSWFFLPQKYKREKAYQGIYIAIPISRKIKSHTLVFHKSLFRKLKVQFDSAEIEDPEFMKKYQILTQDQIEARCILTPVFIERLKKMAQSFRASAIDVAFFEGYALFQLKTRKNMFEPFSIFHKITNIDLFVKFYDEIESICEMINVLQIENKEIADGSIGR